MSALSLATPAPVTRTWMAGDRILARSRVPELVTKTLKVLSSPQSDGSVRRKLRLSSNLLPLLGYQPGARFDAKQLGAGAGIARCPVTDSLCSKSNEATGGGERDPANRNRVTKTTGQLILVIQNNC